MKPLDFRRLLGEGEQILVDVLRSSALGVLDRKTLSGKWGGSIVRLNNGKITNWADYYGLNARLQLWLLI